MRIEKTVFISYRRVDIAWALNVSRDLASHGYDVFLDVTGIASGDFERVIVQNIRARAHFLVLLTPTALDNCGRPQDWLRREIETALEAQRNIIPLTLESFNFNGPDVARKLTGKLAELQHYNALEIPASARYFDEAMRLLRDWLNVPLDAVLHPVSSHVKQATQQQQEVASSSRLDIIRRVASAPLLSNQEQALFETLRPEEQAIMMLQARKQREQLITSIMTNLMNVSDK